MKKHVWFGGALLGALLATAGCGSSGGDVAISGIEPRSGAMQGEQPVKITGQNFRTDIGYTVYFGAKRATSVTIIDPETLVVSTPRVEEEQEVDVTISADNGPAFRIRKGYRFVRPTAPDQAEKATKLPI